MAESLQCLRENPTQDIDDIGEVIASEEGRANATSQNLTESSVENPLKRAGSDADLKKQVNQNKRFRDFRSDGRRRAGSSITTLGRAIQGY